MPWDEAARRRYRRGLERYESDLTDAEWGGLKTCSRRRREPVGRQDVAWGRV